MGGSLREKALLSKKRQNPSGTKPHQSRKKMSDADARRAKGVSHARRARRLAGTDPRAAKWHLRRARAYFGSAAGAGAASGSGSGSAPQMRVCCLCRNSDAAVLPTGCGCVDRAAHADCFVKALPHDGQKYGSWYSCFECRGVYTGRFKKLMAKRWLDISVPTKTAYADVYYAAADNYGDALVEAGDWAEAVRFCTNLRSEMLAAVGPDDARCQGATVNIARAMHGLKNLEGAKAELQALLEKWPDSLGPSHQMRAVAMGNLAAVYLAQGKRNRAEKLAREAHAIQVRVVGSKHSDSRASCAIVADVFARGANYEKGESELRALATKVKGDNGEGSLAYASAANNLAAHLLKMKPDASTTDRDKEALRLLQHSLSVQLAQNGPTHYLTQDAHKNIAEAGRAVASRLP